MFVFFSRKQNNFLKPMRPQAVYLVGSYLATYVAIRSSVFILFSSVGLALSIAQVPFRLFKSLAHRIACLFFCRAGLSRADISDNFTQFPRTLLAMVQDMNLSWTWSHECCVTAFFGLQ